LMSTAEASGGGRSGGGFFGRLSAFLAGCGLSMGLSYGIIWQELKEANDKIYASLQSVDARIKALENGKK